MFCGRYGDRLMVRRIAIGPFTPLQRAIGIGDIGPLPKRMLGRGVAAAPTPHSQVGKDVDIGVNLQAALVRASDQIG